LNFTKDNCYGPMLRLILDRAPSKKRQRHVDHHKPEANPALTGAQITNLIVIAHYELSLV